MKRPKSNLSKCIGSRLSSARRAANYKSARSFATQHQIPISTYAQHETGKRGLNTETLFHYADLLNLNPSWLLTGTGMPYADVTKDIDQKLEILSCELKKVLPTVKVQSLQKIHLEKYSATIVMPILIDITRCIWDAFLAHDAIKLSCNNFIECCIDIYNSIIHITDEVERQSIIDLSIVSLERGIKNDEDDQKSDDPL